MSDEELADAIREEIRDEIADLEEYAKLGKQPPRCRGYRFRVNRNRCDVHEPTPMRETILEVAGLTPAENWTLRLKLSDGKYELIKPSERVNLRRPGVEKFKALPRDQTEGEMTMRCQFEIPEEDRVFLDAYGCLWETVMDGSPWVLLHGFPTQNTGYNHDAVTAAIRIETGYPKVALDMVYFHPALARKDGRAIGATDATQLLDGKVFQRWSRHYTPANPWVNGEHNIGTHIQTIEDWLVREFEK